MVDTPIELSTGQPYKPSWIDRFTSRVELLPVSTRIFYVGLGIFLVLIQILFFTVEGGLQNGELLPVLVFNGLFVAYLLALISFLDDLAGKAFNTMQPVLDTKEPEFRRLTFELTNMPAFLPLAAGLIMLAIAIGMEQLWTVPASYAALQQLPIFSVVFQIIDKSSAFLFGVFIYHTIRQLRLVQTINGNHVRVNLFDARSLQAFSRLTAFTAVGLVIGVYGWMLINPELLTDPLIVGFAGVITILAVTVFVWPLYGIHRRMENAKEKALRQLDRNFGAVIAKFNQGVLDNDEAVVERLNATLSSLEIQHKHISAIPTWPWKPETARFALTAIVLPLILAILQFLATRALAW